MIDIIDINKEFTSNSILKDINFSVEKNEIFGLIGLNGVGKTTLIKIILDLQKADSGKIYINGIENTKKESRSNLKYLPEKFQASSYLKGREFLNIFEPNVNIDNICKMCEILNFSQNMLEQKISKYSKGMMQKLGLISVFTSDANIIILDEPMSGLDPLARNSLKELLLKNKSDRSIFFTSHILSDMDEICDRIGILHNGKIIFLGTTKELKFRHKEDDIEKAFLKEIGF